MGRDLSNAKKLKPHLYERVMLRLFTGEQFGGIWIGAFNDAKPEAKLARVREALRLIKDHDPQRYRRMTRDLRRVLVLRLPPTGRFNPRIEACELDEGFLLAKQQRLNCWRP